MLSTREIGELIAHPGKTTAQHSADLKSLSEKYPYTQIFSILLLKSLKLADDVHFEDELRRNSYRISDRRRLYDLIHEQNTLPVGEIEEEEHLEEKIPESKIEEPEALQEEAVPVIETTTEQPEADKDEIILPPVEQNEESSLISEMNTAVPTEESEMDPLEESILHNSYAANYKLEDLSEEEESALVERHHLPNDNYIPETNEEIARIEIDSKQSFTSWLHSDRNYIDEDDSDKKVITSIVNAFTEFNPLEDLFGEVKKPKADFYSPVKKAKESLNEASLPVSETLAKIYALQGNYPKAIEAYEQLSLKFPEKKIFFANLINDLKKQLNT